jgi:hypothetical protein
LSSKEHNGVMSQYILARNKFKPYEGVKLLLIAESPPASGGYFYFDRATGKDSLFRETMKALGMFPEDKKMPKGFDKRPLLKEFQLRGFFVVDASYEPVDKLRTREKKLVITKEIPRLIADIRKLNPEKIVIVKSSLFVLVKKALEKAGIGEKILNPGALPFPSHGHQKTFRQTLRRLIAERKG